MPATPASRFDKLGALAMVVAKAAGRAIPKGKAIVGEHIFTHESGIHVDGLLKDRRTYQALDPALLGRDHRASWSASTPGTPASAPRWPKLGLPMRARARPAPSWRRCADRAAATKHTVNAGPAESARRLAGADIPAATADAARPAAMTPQFQEHHR